MSSVTSRHWLRTPRRHSSGPRGKHPRVLEKNVRRWVCVCVCEFCVDKWVKWSTLPVLLLSVPENFAEKSALGSDEQKAPRVDAEQCKEAEDYWKHSKLRIFELLERGFWEKQVWKLDVLMIERQCDPSFIQMCEARLHWFPKIPWLIAPGSFVAVNLLTATLYSQETAKSSVGCNADSAGNVKQHLLRYEWSGTDRDSDIHTESGKKVSSWSNSRLLQAATNTWQSISCFCAARKTDTRYLLGRWRQQRATPCFATFIIHQHCEHSHWGVRQSWENVAHTTCKVEVVSQRHHFLGYEAECAKKEKKLCTRWKQTES